MAVRCAALRRPNGSNFYRISQQFIEHMPSLLLSLLIAATFLGSFSSVSLALIDSTKQDITSAIRDADVYTLQKLLTFLRPHDLDEEFCMGLTPLQYAAKTNGATIGVLLEAGSDPRLSHRATSTTPLMFASRSGDIAAVEALLAAVFNEAGAIDAVDEHGSTALGLCSLTCNVEVARLLLAVGADVFKPDATGNTALHVGAFYCTEPTATSFAELLVHHNDDLTSKHVNDMSQFGRTALMLATKKGNVGFCAVLLQAGADEALVSPYDQKTVRDFQLEL